MKPGYTFAEHIRTEKLSRKYKLSRDNAHPFRDYILLLLLCLGVGLLFVKLITTQIFQGTYYRGLADSNRVRTRIVHAPRGIIFDRNGIPLVLNSPGYSILNKGKISFLSNEDALASIAKGQQNIAITSLRHYPFKDSLSHVIGYTGQISPDQLQTTAFSDYQVDDLVGKSGIEAYYEHDLRGIDGKQLLEVNALGQIVRTLGQTDPIPGKNITLTIDSSLQQATYTAMRDVAQGAAVVSTPQGEILSLVSVPSYDPNLFTFDPNYTVASDSAYTSIASVLMDGTHQPLLNRAISGVYPPGSTFKIVTSASGLEQHVIDDSYTIQDTGVLTIGKFSFANWYYTEYGKKEQQPIDVVRAIARSNDIFFYKLADKIGIDKLSQTAHLYGIGTRLGIDLQGEAKGTLPTIEWKKQQIHDDWYTGDTYQYGIGQGFLLTTPLQVNAWTSVIANQGVLYQPHILKNIPPHIIRKNLLAKNNYDLIQKGMIEACSTGGVAWPLFNFIVKNKSLPVDGLDVTTPMASSSATPLTSDDRQITLACKTGTAQHGDDQTKPHAWITIFAPAYHPQIVVTVLSESSGEGSNVAAPIAKQILTNWFERK